MKNIAATTQSDEAIIFWMNTAYPECQGEDDLNDIAAKLYNKSQSH